MTLRRLPYLNDLGLGFVADLGCGGLCRLRNGASALVGGRAEEFLREGAQVGLEMPASAGESAIKRRANLIVERHSRIIRPLSDSGSRV